MSMEESYQGQKATGLGLQLAWVVWLLCGLRGSLSGHPVPCCGKMSGKSFASNHRLVQLFAFPEGLMILENQSKARGDYTNKSIFF